MTKEKAVSAGQLSQLAQPYSTRASVGYFEPHKLTDLRERGRLYLIADAISGTASSQVASQYAIQKVLHSFYTSDSKDSQQQLLDAIKQANADIVDKNNQYPERRVMATTLMAAWIHESKLVVMNVGDNRAYVVWDQDIELLTHEVSLANERSNGGGDKKSDVPLLPAKTEELAVEEKSTTQEDSLPRQRLPHGLGLDKEIKIRVFSRRLFAGDIVVLCSGGLIGYVSEKEIAETVNSHPPEEAIRNLMSMARERGNRDQLAISVTKVLPESVADRPATPMSPPIAPSWNRLTPTVKSNGTTPSTAPKPTIASATQPLPDTKQGTDKKTPTGTTPASVTQRMFADPQLTKSFAEVFDPNHNRQRLYMIVGLLMLICATVFWGWQYVIPRYAVASVPGLSSIDSLMRSDEDESKADERAVTLKSRIATQAAQTVTPATPRASNRSTGAAAAPANYPISTPTASFASPVNTPTPTGSDTGSAADEVTLLSTPTPQPTIQLPPGCENRARFYRDVTVSDGTEFAPGEEFEKVWLLSNANTCPWGPGYTVQFMDGDRMGADEVIPLTEVVEPETNGEIRVPMVAPEEPGSYRGEWQLHDLEGEPFGPKMYLEIAVVGPDPSDVDADSFETVYDFIENADKATWTSGDVTYTPQATEIDETLELSTPEGLVATGSGLLRGNAQSERDVLLTYPHLELGFIEGKYQVDEPLQPTDALVANLGFTKLSILSDDGVTFEVIFIPDDGSESQALISTNVQYKDSPVADTIPLSNISPGQTGTFVLRVLGGDSLSQDWAIWIDLRLVRPE